MYGLEKPETLYRMIIIVMEHNFKTLDLIDMQAKQKFEGASQSQGGGMLPHPLKETLNSNTSYQV